MTLSTGQRRPHFKNTLPSDPAITPLAAWPLPNRSFLSAFKDWLKTGGYSPSALNLYSVAARLALGYLNKVYWTIDPEIDLEKVRSYIARRYPSPSTCREYNKGLRKLAEYIRLRQDKATRSKPIHWGYHLNGLPDWLCEQVREFVAHKQKGWPLEKRQLCLNNTLSKICATLRWMATASPVREIGDLTPQRWFDFMDAHLLAGKHVNTINARLFHLQAFLRFQDENGALICQRMLLVPPLQNGARLPKDAPITELRRILDENERETRKSHANQRRMGVMDRAWLHLMLYSGLRTGEVRRLRLGDIQWESQRVRIEQSKGLKDRLVYLNSATLEALQTWLAERGTPEYLSDHVFVYRCRPLSSRYCGVRMNTYGKRCGVEITPHQLRHSCATLLLNAGAPVLSVQALLGHEKVDTTLGYARLYDGTVAADYYRAMGQVEHLLDLPESVPFPITTPAELIALVDSLGNGTLSERQRETVQALREGILSLAIIEPAQI